MNNYSKILYKIVSGLLLLAGMIGCISAGPAAEDLEVTGKIADKIIPFKIEVDNFDSSQTNLSSWIYAFSYQDQGYGHAVKSFTAPGEIYTYTKQQMQKMRLKGGTYVARTIASRIHAEVDFENYDVAVVYLTDGGPPFGKFKYKLKQTQEVEFCIRKPNNPSGVSGMALKIIFKMYKIPKGLKVSLCK